MHWRANRRFPGVGRRSMTSPPAHGIARQSLGHIKRASPRVFCPMNSVPMPQSAANSWLSCCTGIPAVLRFPISCTKSIMRMPSRFPTGHGRDELGDCQRRHLRHTERTQGSALPAHKQHPRAGRNHHRKNILLRNISPVGFSSVRVFFRGKIM